MKRPSFFQFNNGSKVPLPFSDKEYENRLNGLREIISQNNLDAVLGIKFLEDGKGSVQGS